MYAEGILPVCFLKVFVKNDILLKPESLAASFTGAPSNISLLALSHLILFVIMVFPVCSLNFLARLYLSMFSTAMKLLSMHMMQQAAVLAQDIKLLSGVFGVIIKD